MAKRLLAVALVCGLLPSPAFAQSIQKAIKAEAVRAAQTQRPAARGRNPYQTPAIVLLGVGAGLFVLAFVSPSGFKCDADDDFNVDCGTTANKGLLFGGLGAAGVGAYLYFKGENMRGPNIKPVSRGLVLEKRIRF